MHRQDQSVHVATLTCMGVGPRSHSASAREQVTTVHVGPASAGGCGCQTAITNLGVNRRGSLLANAGELWEKDVRLPSSAATRSWEPGPGLNCRQAGSMQAGQSCNAGRALTHTETETAAVAVEFRYLACAGLARQIPLCCG